MDSTSADLSGQTALVTGSTAGIGYAVACALHRAGATVIVHGRRTETVAKAVDNLGAGDRLFGVASDLATEQGCRDLCASVADVSDDLDILVNNAGTYENRAALELTAGEWEAAFRLNSISGALLTAHFGATMTERGYGRIVFVSSESAVHIPADKIHYGVSKLAQLGIANGYARAFAGTGVLVNSVLPGPTPSAGNADVVDRLIAEGAAGSVAEAQAVISQTRPPSLLRRWTSAEEVANVVVFLASPLSGAITGASVRADGGIIGTVL